MHRKFITTVAAASILITGFAAAPARADQDFGRALAAIVGVAVVGAIIHDSKKDRKEHARVQQAPRYKTRVVTRQHNHVKARPLPKRVRNDHGSRARFGTEYRGHRGHKLARH